MNQNSCSANPSPDKNWKPTLSLYAETQLPTEFGVFRTVVFLDEEDQKEHLAMIYGDIDNQENVLVRMHSECFTGEVLHSLKCDCREQLHAGLTEIAQSGCGILIYLRQEGRGIGLGNKIRAYALQEQGYDTVDANRMLGFEDDQRTYEVAFQILEHFKVRSVRLLTNNPEKLHSLQSSGIIVTERVPLLCPPNPHSLEYFKTKQERMGHFLESTHLPPTVSPTAHTPTSSDTLATHPLGQMYSRHCMQGTRHLHRLHAAHVAPPAKKTNGQGHTNHHAVHATNTKSPK